MPPDVQHLLFYLSLYFLLLTIINMQHTLFLPCENLLGSRSLIVCLYLYTFKCKCFATSLCTFDYCCHYCVRVSQAPPRPGTVLQCGMAVTFSAGAGQLCPASLCAPLCPLPAGSDSGQEPRPRRGNSDQFTKQKPKHTLSLTQVAQ